MQPGESLEVDAPMTRYECCKHCSSLSCPRFDGHIGACQAKGCTQGTTMIGEYKAEGG